MGHQADFVGVPTDLDGEALSRQAVQLGSQGWQGGGEINRLSVDKQAIKLFIKKLHDVFHKKLQKLGLVSPRAHMRAWYSRQDKPTTTLQMAADEAAAHEGGCWSQQLTRTWIGTGARRRAQKTI